MRNLNMKFCWENDFVKTYKNNEEKITENDAEAWR